MHHEHPLRIIRYTKKTLWLLIFPILRGAYHVFNREVLLEWLEGAWMDLLILLFIIAYGWLCWYMRVFTVRDGQIYVKEGIFYTRRRIIPVRNLSALTIEHPFLLRPLKAAYLNADTASGLLGTTDLKLMIRCRDEELFRKALPRIRQGKRHNTKHKGSFLRTVIFSVIFSSSFSGTVYMVVFWFQSGRIARDLIAEWQIQERFGTMTEEIAQHLTGIPPIAVAVGLLFLSTWFLSFISNMLRYGGFLIESDRRMISVRSGLLTKRLFYLTNRKINFADIRQNLLTKFFRIFSLAVNCPGYGTQRGSIPICMPILTRKEMDEVVPMIFPDIRLTGNTLRTPWTSWLSYVNVPVFWGIMIIPAAQAARHYFPQMAEATNFFQVMLLLPLAWKLAVQITALVTTGLSITDGRICVRWCKGTTFHTIITDTDCIAKIRIRRNLFHRINGKCHLILYFQSEVTRKCVLRSLYYAEVQKAMAFA